MLMKRTVIVLLLVFSLALSACARRSNPQPVGADAPADNVPDIVGEYALNGVDFFEQEYGGRLTIKAGDQPGQYLLYWLVTGYVQEGVGTLEGNQLSVEWWTVSGPIEDLHGTALYTVTVNGELYGTRTAEGFEVQETETAYPNEE